MNTRTNTTNKLSLKLQNHVGTDGQRFFGCIVAPNSELGWPGQPFRLRLKVSFVKCPVQNLQTPWRPSILTLIS